MRKSSGYQSLKLGDGILREPGSVDGRIVLWLPGARNGEFRYWERIGTVSGGEMQSESGIWLVAATSVPARQRLSRSWRTLLRRPDISRGVRTWLLPDGGEAEQAGERREGLILVWSEDGSTMSDWIARRWPEVGKVRTLGPGLYLAEEAVGVVVARSVTSDPSSLRTTPQLHPGTSRQMVRQAVAILAADSGTRDGKAALWEGLAAQIVEYGRKQGSRWGMQRLLGWDGSLIYLGRAAEFLVFDPSGRLYRGQGLGCLAGSRDGRLLPHYPGMKLVP